MKTTQEPSPPLLPALLRHRGAEDFRQPAGGAHILAHHSNISTTSLYTHVVDEELDRAYWEAFKE